MTFDEFLAAELAPLRRYAAVLTGDTHRAEDVLADALVKAYTRWRKIARTTNPAAYVHRIVTTTFISSKRRWSARHVTTTTSGELPETAGAARVIDPTDAVDDRAQLAGPLAALPRQQRAAVVLRYYLGYDHAAIATELGISTGAARTAVSRALAKLRVTVDRDDEYDASRNATDRYDAGHGRYDAGRDGYDAAPASGSLLKEDS